MFSKIIAKNIDVNAVRAPAFVLTALVRRAAKLVAPAAVCLWAVCTLDLHSGYSQAATREIKLHDSRLPAGSLNFALRFFSTASENPGLSLLNITVGFVNDELQFVTTTDKKFRADFQILLNIHNLDSSRVDSTVWSGHVIAQNFDETVSDKLSHTFYGQIELAPKEYRYRVQLTDLETRSGGFRAGAVTVRDFSSDSLAISDIALLDAATLAQMLELNHAELADSSGYVFFEIYNLPTCDSAKIQYEISEPMSQKLVKGEKSIVTGGRITRNFVAIRKSDVTNESIFNFNILCGDTTFALQQRIKSSGQRETRPEINLDDAIEQLRYIAKGDEMKKLKKARGEDRVKEFQAFWDKRDPSPETRENEYYDEYYRRVEYASKAFGDNGTGWRTDFGMVFILLGSPDYVDRPLNSNDYFDSFSNRRLLIVWHYLRFARRVIFRYEIGEYRIANQHEVFDILNDGMRF